MLAITARSPYALRALTELVRAGGSGPVPMAEIARRREIPVQFLEGLFATLRRAGILHSQRGVKGGYSLARPATEVTVLEIVELLEGDLASEAERSGPIWSESVGALRAVLRTTTLAEVAAREEREAGASMYYI